MSDEINYQNNPLHGVGLKQLLTELVDHYGFEILYAYLNINCFNTNPSIESSVRFLKKTDWAREKVESFYLYQLKNLPRASDEQFALSPRDRIVPEGQVPREPAELSLEDAERLREKRALKTAARASGPGRPASGKPDGGRTRKPASGKPGGWSTDKPKKRSDTDNEPAAPATGAVDPWAKWRK